MGTNPQPKDDGERGGGGGGNGGRSDTKARGTSPLEWALAAASALLVVGCMAVLLYEALTTTGKPPSVEVTVEEISRVAGGYLVEFKAENRGETTAAGLVVEGELKSGSESVEKSSVTIDYVPAEAIRKGGLYFTRDPSGYALEINARGFDFP